MKEITVKELKQMMDSNEDFKLIDVREPHENEFCNIGGELIPMGELMHNLDKIPQDRKVILHCKSGGRSGALAQALEKQGFTNVFNLKGGIIAWSDEIDPSVPKY